MAVRLMKRCTCLLREATRLVPTVAPVGRLRLAGVSCKTLTSSVSSPSSGSLTELLGKEQVFTPYPEHQELDFLIEKASRPEQLLELLGSDHSLHHNHAALILIRLSYLLSEKPKEKALLAEDARFQRLVKLVDSQEPVRYFRDKQPNAGLLSGVEEMSLLLPSSLGTSCSTAEP